ASETTVTHVRELLGRALAAQDRVAMREAAEAADDVAMVHGPLGVAVATSPDQCDRTLLLGEILCVLERQVAEPPEFRRELPVLAGVHHPACEVHGQRIGRVRMPG